MMRRLAWPVFGVWVLLTVVASILLLLTGRWVDAVIAPLLVVLAGVGALLMRRRPDNAVGGVLSALALLITLSVASTGVYARHEGGSAPPAGVALLVWFDEWVIFLWFGLVGVLLPLLFPDGKLPSRRWRPVLVLGVAVVGAEVLGTALGTRRFGWGENGSIRNPVALGGAAGDGARLIADAADVALVPLLLCTLAASASRFRRSHGIERQQLKWFAFAISLVLVGLSAAAVSESTGYEPLGNVGWTVFLGGLIFGLPLAIGTAILRHRLYDIDLVIKSTLVYAVLTASLAATYLGLVLLLRLALSPVTGESDLAVAASTLAVAALFRPARGRIQSVVDRRFYRARYDAARTVEAFSNRLRDELDLAALGLDLRQVVTETVAPTRVTLWLREVPR